MIGTLADLKSALMEASPYQPGTKWIHNLLGEVTVVRLSAAHNSDNPMAPGSVFFHRVSVSPVIRDRSGREWPGVVGVLPCRRPPPSRCGVTGYMSIAGSDSRFHERGER